MNGKFCYLGKKDISDTKGRKSKEKRVLSLINKINKQQIY